MQEQTEVNKSDNYEKNPKQVEEISFSKTF